MFKIKKAGDFFILHLLYAHRRISSEVIASVAKLKKKKKRKVYGSLYFVSIRKQLFCQILLYRLTVIHHRLLNSEGKPISWTGQLR